MSHICKMAGMEAVLPCAAPQCPAYGDCAAVYEKTRQGFQLEQHPKTNLERYREMTAEQLAEWIMCPYSMDPDLCIDRIHAGKVYIRCKCGCTIEKPFSFVSRNSPESYTLNESLICPQCHAESLSRTDLTNIPSKRITTPPPRYGKAVSSGCPFCGKSNIQAVKKGFGLGKAAVGGLLLGSAGLLGGAIGANDIQFVCLSCGRKWNK